MLFHLEQFKVCEESSALALGQEMGMRHGTLEPPSSPPRAEEPRFLSKGLS